MANGIIHATWVGGEPTLRPDVLEAAATETPLNWVVTNGMKVKKTMAGPDCTNWDIENLPKNVWFIVSLDGVGGYHNMSRAHVGLYEKIYSRFFKTHRSRRTITTTTLHKGNINQAKDLLREWQTSSILGMTFEFATPIGRSADPSLDIVGETRNKVIDELIHLKRRYGSFMRNSVSGLEMQRSENLPRWVGAKNCPTVKYSVSFDSLGRVKTPCILGSSLENPRGKKPNCAACGCHVPTIFEGLKKFDLQTLSSAFWFLS